MKKKTILCLIMIFCLLLTGCKGKNTEKHALSKEQIIDILEKDNTSSLKLVKDVSFADNNITIDNVKMKVNGEEVSLGDYKNTIQGETSKLITGYYDEQGLTYYLYRLSTNQEGKNTIWELAVSKNDKFENVGWIATFIENPSDLIMVEFNEVPGVNNTNYQKYGIYTIVNKELVKVR